MKDAEDEAFDELARKQGSWGGGFKAKQAMAADKLQEPVAWALEWTFDGEEKGRRLYDDERHCKLDAENDGGICRPLVYGYTAPPQPAQEPVKLWLWKNFVDGKPEYWAFDNPFPIFMDSHNPQTLGEPCGYAWFKPSRAGRTDVSEEQVLLGIQKALAQPAQEPDWKTMPPKDAPLVQWAKEQTAPPQRPWVGLTDEEIALIHASHPQEFARALMAKLKERNS